MKLIIIFFSELFHTEQTHVRVLKVLKKFFYVPMQDLVSQELLNMLFPNLDQILEYHSNLNQSMKKRRIDEPLVKTVGDILFNTVSKLVFNILFLKFKSFEQLKDFLYISL